MVWISLAQGLPFDSASPINEILKAMSEIVGNLARSQQSLCHMRVVDFSHQLFAFPKSRLCTYRMFDG